MAAYGRTIRATRAPYSTSTRSIGAVFPNEQGIDKDWSHFRVPVAQIEKMTGYTFWRNIPKATGKAIKKDVDEVQIPRSKSSKTSE